MRLSQCCTLEGCRKHRRCAGLHLHGSLISAGEGQPSSYFEYRIVSVRWKIKSSVRSTSSSKLGRMNVPIPVSIHPTYKPSEHLKQRSWTKATGNYLEVRPTSYSSSGNSSGSRKNVKRCCVYGSILIGSTSTPNELSCAMTLSRSATQNAR